MENGVILALDLPSPLFCLSLEWCADRTLCDKDSAHAFELQAWSLRSWSLACKGNNEI